MGAAAASNGLGGGAENGVPIPDGKGDGNSTP